MISKRHQGGLFWGAVGNYVALGLNMAVGFLLTPFVVHHLGKSQYGGWTLVLTLANYSALLDLGVTAAVAQAVAVRRHENRIGETSRIINSALFIFLITGLVLVVVSVIFGGWLLSELSQDVERLDNAKLAFICMSVAIAIDFVGAVFGAVCTAHENFRAVNVASVIRSVIRAALIVAFLTLGGALESLAIAQVVTGAIVLAWLWLACRRQMPLFRISWGDASWAAAKPLLFYGGVATVIRLADLFRLPIGTVFISRWRSLGEVGVYGVAVTLMTYGVSIVGSGTMVLTPRLSSLHGTGAHDELRALLQKALRVSSVLAFGLVGGLAIFAKSFLHFWLGAGFEQAGDVIAILALGFGMALAQGPSINYLLALKKHHYYAVVICFESLANVVLCSILISPYGMRGVAFALAIPMLVVKGFVQPNYVSRLAGMRLKNYLMPTFVAILVTAPMVAAAYCFGVPAFAAKSVAHFIGSIVLYLAIFGWLAARLMLGGELCRELLSKVLPKSIRLGRPASNGPKVTVP